MTKGGNYIISCQGEAFRLSIWSDLPPARCINSEQCHMQLIKQEKEEGAAMFGYSQLQRKTWIWDASFFQGKLVQMDS